METVILSVWSGLFPLLLFFVSVGLVVTARLKRWTAVEPAPEPAAESAPIVTPRSARKRLADFFARHRWELALAAASAGILLFAVLFAPPRLTGEIPIDPGLPGRPFYSLHWQRTFLVNNFDAIATASNIAAGLVCLAPILIAIRRRSRLHAEAALLFTSLSLAMFSQWMLARVEFKAFGVMAHLFAIFGFG